MNSVRSRTTSSVAANSASPMSAITIVSSSSDSFSRAISRVIVIGSFGLQHERLDGLLWPRRQRPPRRLRLGLHQLADEIVQQHVVKVMMPDAQLLARGVDAVPRIEVGREDAQVDVGHERAQQHHAVALLDELA